MWSESNYASDCRFSNLSDENGHDRVRVLRERLLAGSSAIAIGVATTTGAVVTASKAQAADLTLAVAEEWRDGTNVTSEVTGLASAADNVNLVTFTLTVDDTGDATAIGAITGSTGDLTITTDTSNTDISATIGSITLTGNGALTINNLDADNAAVTVAVTGAVSTGGALVITSTEASVNESTIVTITGNTEVTGASSIVASAGGGAGGDVTLNLNGATVTFTAGITMDDNTGLSTMVFTPTAAQTVTGAINAVAAANEGTVNVVGGTNLSTFATAIGGDNNLLALNVGAATLGGNAKFSAAVDVVTITVSTDATSDAAADFDAAVTATNIAITGGGATTDLATASFKGNVTASTAITLDEGSAGVAGATITFDGTAAQAVTGDIQGQGDNEGVIVITNTAGAVTFNDDIGDVTNSLAISDIQIRSGASMIVDAGPNGDNIEFDVTGNVDADGAAETGGTLTIAAGDGVSGGDAVASTIAAGSNITGNVALTTLTLSGGDGLDGDGNTASGGAVTAFTVGGTTTAAVNITGGEGANGKDDDATAGGIGGAITTSTFTGLVTGDVAVSGGGGGNGADGGGSAAGGAGGVGGAATVADFTAGITGALTLTGGNGGVGGSGATSNLGGVGGNGGAVTVTTMGALSSTLTVNTGTGANGGIPGAANGGNGGDGGAVTIGDIDGAVGGNVTVVAGNGGIGAAGGAVGTAGTGGDGGLFTLTDLTGATSLAFSFTAGSGGDAGNSAATAGAVGGAGGGITITDITSNTSITGDFSLIGGSGGTGGAGNGAQNGGEGGDGGTIAATVSGAITGAVSLTAGAGGTGGGAGSSTGNGGDGGVGSSITATFEKGISSTITIDDGATASDGAADTGTVGEGGAGGTVTVTMAGAAAATYGGAVTVNDDGEGIIIVTNETTTGATFSSTIGTDSKRLGRLTVGAATDEGDAVFSGNVFADTINVGKAGNWGDDGSTTANFDGSVNFTTLTIEAGTNAAGEDASMSAAGDVLGTTLTFTDASGNGTSTLTLDGTARQTVSAELTATAATLGVLAIDNDATFQANIGSDSGNELTSINLATGKKLLFDRAITVGATDFNIVGTGELTLADTLTLDAGTDLDLASSGAATLVLDPTTSYTGGVVITGEAGGATVTLSNTLTVTPPANFTSGTLTLVDDENGGNIVANVANITVSSNALATYAATAANTNDVIITATQASAASIASSLSISAQEGAGVASASGALSGAPAADSDIVDAFNTAIVAGGSEGKKAAQQVTLQSDSLGAAAAASTGGGAAVAGISSSRLASLRTGAAYASSDAAGFAAGNGAMSKNLWLRPFGSETDQDATGGVAGFEASTYGMVAGLDVPVGRGNAGVSISYANTSVDGEGAGQSSLEIDSYGINLYGDVTGNRAYFQFTAGYAANENDTSRKLNFSTLSRTASGSFDSTQYTISAETGMPRRYGSNSFITPHFGLAHTNVSYDSYTETGAGSLNLTVSQDDTDVTLATAGVRLHSVHNNGRFIPELRAALQYDLSGDEAEATSTFAGGGAAFTTTGAEVEAFGGTAGVGLTWAGAGGSSLSLNYDAAIKSDYMNHTGAAEVRVSF